MQEEKGTLSIHTENIFPIIKKFLYSDHEIFLRELVSNAVDASQKLKRLSSLGDFKGELGELKIKVSVNKDAKTITVSDRGIGLTSDEIKKYINQIAFSGASEFVEKYKDKIEEKQIIGHFGLGFYSSFMVAKKVEIITKSYQEGAEPARWECTGNTDFEISPAVKKDRGTDVVLHVADDSEEFLEESRLKQILEKYCKFMPVEIEFNGEQINNPEPIWTKSPSELKDEDYLKFYKELHPFAEDPLFWIHLNVDYPFELTGILYFPKTRGEFEVNRNKIQLYCRQVFITDEVKDVVPEFLMLLHGVIDSPDIPLNVSRSFLQSDSNVKKINNHISKKVADKLSELYKKDQEAYEKKWNDISLFVKYGMISDDKFYEKAKDFCLLKNIDDKSFPIQQYQDHIRPNQTDKDGNLVALYATDPRKQDAYIESAKNKGYDILLLDNVIDSHFINLIESKFEKFSLKRVDSERIDKIIDKDEKVESVLGKDEQKKVEETFRKVINNDQVKLSLEALSPEELPVTVTVPEFMRRMKDMAIAGGNMGMSNMPETFEVVVNSNNKFISKIASSNEGDKERLAKQAYDLGLLSQGMLKGKELTAFIKRSIELEN